MPEREVRAGEDTESRLRVEWQNHYPNIGGNTLSWVAMGVNPAVEQWPREWAYLT